MGVDNAEGFAEAYGVPTEIDETEVAVDRLDQLALSDSDPEYSHLMAEAIVLAWIRARAPRLATAFTRCRGAKGFWYS